MNNNILKKSFMSPLKNLDQRLIVNKIDLQENSGSLQKPNKTSGVEMKKLILLAVVSLFVSACAHSHKDCACGTDKPACAACKEEKASDTSDCECSGHKH